MGRPVIDLTGQRFGKLKVIQKTDQIASNGTPKWLCRCDCGNLHIVERSNLQNGSVKSCGKCRTYNTYDLESKDYGIGYTSNGDEFYFDKEDYDLISQYNWCVTGSGYLFNSKQGTLLMHRLIMNAPKNLMIDHINHNTLDNRKENLRLCTASQNNINKKIKGYTKRGNNYEVTLRINGTPKYIGRFQTKEEAIAARISNYDEDHKLFAMEI